MKLKRTAAFLAALVLCGVSIPAGETLSVRPALSAAAASAEDVLDYYESDGAVTIRGIKDTSLTEIVIPEKIAGAPVTAIGRNAFKQMENIQSVTLPEGLRTIGQYAFVGCSSLKEIVLPESLESVEQHAFEMCTSLESVTIPKGLRQFGADVFWGTPWIEAQREQETLVVYNGVLLDGQAASGSCVIPDTVEILAPMCFANNEKITSVTFPETVTRIEEGAFSGCNGIREDFVFPQSLTYIGPAAFNNCPQKHVTIPGSCKYIGKDAFNVNGITSVTLEEGVEHLGRCAFADNAYLEEVEIPSTLRYFDGACFNNTPFMKKIQAEQAFWIVNDVLVTVNIARETLTLPDGIRSIAGEAFQGGTVRTLVVPESLTEFQPLATDGSTITTLVVKAAEVSVPGDNSYPHVTDFYAPAGGTIEAMCEEHFMAFHPIEEFDFSKAEEKQGDFNGDQEINASDAALILQTAAKQGAAGLGPQDFYLRLCDLNSDEQLNASDAALVLMYAAAQGAGFDGTLGEYLAGSGE